MTLALPLTLAALLAQAAPPTERAALAQAVPPTTPTVLAKTAQSAKPVASDGGRGFAVSFAGGVAALPLEWQAPATWTLNAEKARLDASQAGPLGPVAEAAVSYRFARRFGVAAAFAWSRRDGSAEIEALLPHPFYLDRPRTVSGSVSGLGYRQIASHLDLEWRPVTARFELAFFAGPSFVRAEADLVESVTASEAYPYDEATFASASASPSRSAASVGWNAGTALAGAVASRVDLGVRARYSRAKPELTTPGGSVALEAGGLDVTAFLRLRF